MKGMNLTMNQIWIALGIFLTTIGSAFGVGIKVQCEIAKVEAAKVEMIYTTNIGKVKLDLLESERKQRENLENMIFFQNQYTAYKSRYEKCEKGETYTKAVE